MVIITRNGLWDNSLLDNICLPTDVTILLLGGRASGRVGKEKVMWMCDFDVLLTTKFLTLCYFVVMAVCEHRDLPLHGDLSINKLVVNGIVHLLKV